MSTSAAAQESTARPATAGHHDGKAIFHPVVDFLCLGGLTFLILPIIYMLPSTAKPALIAITFFAADLINHPHFAVSYQIFYRGFREKAFGDALSPSMRIRYQIAGIWGPLAILGFYAVALLRGDTQLMGWGAAAMTFLVGWHYTKQGYGMLIVDSVFKRRFFGEAEKKVFLYNAYTCWFLYWLFGNWLASERNFWGLKYYALPIPEWVLWVVGSAAAVTTLMSLRLFARRLFGDGPGLPTTGVMAYLVTIYIWLFALLQPMLVLVVPALHSLQYLLIVSRFEINRTRALGEQEGRSATWPLVRFAVFAIGLGMLGFWGAPKLLELTVAYDREFWGGMIFLFMFWIFINVHHYLIDNVIWRKDNPETGTYLFGIPKKG